MTAFEITTQSSDLMPLDRRGRGEVKFLVTNGLGRSVRAQLRAEPEGDQGARSDWLIVDKTEHAFAPGGATMATVKVAVPAGTPAGRYPFRLVVAATDEQGGEPVRSAPVTLRHDTGNRALWAALVIGGVLVAAIGAGVYRWVLGPPACAVERAVYDDAAAACVCPAGMVEGQIGARLICLCASGTTYDERSDACVPRSCDVDGALYAEAAGQCECPLGTQQATVNGRARCVCPPGQKYDPAIRACAPHACPAPEGARYDERTGQCECPPGAQRTTSGTGQEACGCPAGHTFDEATQRCLTLPNLRVLGIYVFPPLRIDRQFRLETTIENTGETASGPSRLHIEVSRAGVSFRDQLDVPALAPGTESKYRSPNLRIEINEPVLIRVRAEPLGFVEGSAEDNVVEKSFPIRTKHYKAPR
jgi:hypothetical protein